MLDKEEIKIEVNKVLEMLYWLYLNELKNGNIQNGIYKAKHSVGKWAYKKSRAFQQTAFEFRD